MAFGKRETLHLQSGGKMEGMKQFLNGAGGGMNGFVHD